MKILQRNLRRNRVLDDLLKQIIKGTKADLIIISEQYRTIDVSGSYTDTLGTAQIWIVDVSSYT